MRAARAQADAVDAELLLAHVLERPRSWLYAHRDALLDAAQAGAFGALLARRAAGEPVAYLTGHRGFWRFELAVTPETLVPRAETECLVECALARLPARVPAPRLADLGTGSGAIALALALERPRATVLATDASAGALAVARANARRLGLGNVSFAHGHWWQAVPAGERFHLVASNPPYIAEGDPHLAQGDLPHEPRGALVSGADGLEALREIVAGAPARLLPGGWLVVEHGMDQGAAVRALLGAAGLDAVGTSRDLEGRDRVTAGCLPA